MIHPDQDKPAYLRLKRADDLYGKGLVKGAIEELRAIPRNEMRMITAISVPMKLRRKCKECVCNDDCKVLALTLK